MKPYIQGGSLSPRINPPTQKGYILNLQRTHKSLVSVTAQIQVFLIKQTETLISSIPSRHKLLSPAQKSDLE